MTAVEATQDWFSVCSEQRGHTAYLRLHGELDINTSPILERSLHEAESNGYTAVVLDLEHLTFLDASGGLRAFLGAAERAVGAGRTFAIVHPSAIVLKLLGVTQTTHLLAAAPAARSSAERMGTPAVHRARASMA